MKVIERIAAPLKRVTTIYAVISGIAVALLLGAGGWFAHHQITAHNEAIRQADLRQQKQLASEAANNLQKLQSDNKTDNKSSDGPKTTDKSTSSSPAAPALKYSVSSDPRSTAYSTTPPAPNPASFIIKITHPGQIPAGTLISYNATKGEKTYYSGDLILSPSVITYSKSTYTNLTFSVSLPDGRITRGANLPWDESNQVAFVAFQGTSAPAPATSVSQIVQLYNAAATPNGTYQIHIVGGATNPPSSDGWEYDGFLTLIVTD